MTATIVLLILLVLPGSPAIAVQKIALIIGNSSYKTAPIPNSVRDADLIAGTLRKLDFDVVIGKNLDRKKMRRAIRNFGDRLTKDTIGLFYYSGHGMQVRGINYMIPVNEDIRSDIDVEDSGVTVKGVLGRMHSARTRLNIIVLDACRNNPYEKSYKDGGQGLSKMDAPPGTLIGYATAPGRVADTGESGSVSPYTKALTDELLISKEPILQLFNTVSYKLWGQYGADQTPYIESTAVPNISLLFDVAVLTPPPTNKPNPVPSALLRFQQECDKGYAASCTELGFKYQNGKGVAKDYIKAAALYRQGCNGGNVQGCSNLGAMYQFGEGVPQDDKKAAALYKQSCDGGSAFACMWIGSSN